MPMTLQEKLRAVLIGTDDTGRGPIAQCAGRPFRGILGKAETTWEDDLRDWGVFYGVAFGIARGEEPFEPVEDVANRALEVAWPLYLEWGGAAEWPQMNEDEARAAGAIA